MSKVQIKGLNQRQRAIADVLWMMNSRAEVNSFIRALHPTMRADAETVVEMMIWAVCDEIESTQEAQIELDRIRNR